MLAGRGAASTNLGSNGFNHGWMKSSKRRLMLAAQFLQLGMALVTLIGLVQVRIAGSPLSGWKFWAAFLYWFTLPTLVLLPLADSGETLSLPRIQKYVWLASWVVLWLIVGLLLDKTQHYR